MKVDMSPEAVMGRLKRVDQLWELTMALKVAGRGPRRRVEGPTDSQPPSEEVPQGALEADVN